VGFAQYDTSRWILVPVQYYQKKHKHDNPLTIRVLRVIFPQMNCY